MTKTQKNNEQFTIYLTHLYPQEMAIYGDIGNIIALKFKLEKLGFNVIVQNIDSKSENMPEKNDFIFIGGGADKNQVKISKHLLKFTEFIKDQIINKKTPLLSICGGYQLLGKEFITGNGQCLQGLEIFPVTTKAPSDSVKERCVGNIIINANFLDGKLVGFENHSGQTIACGENFTPLGKTVLGNGNNKKDQNEGCILYNAIGTYMHGPCLSKNPKLVDWFVQKILENKGLKKRQTQEMLENVDNFLENSAHQSIINRFL